VASSIHGVVEGLAHAAGAAVAKPASAPDARLAVNLQAAQRRVWTAIATAEAAGGVCQGVAARLLLTEAAVVVRGRRDASQAARDGEAGLCIENAEAHPLTVHQEVEGLAEAGAVAAAGHPAAPDAGLPVDLQAIPLAQLLTVAAAEAGAQVRYRVAARRVRLEAADVGLWGPLRDPVRHQRRRPSRAHVARHKVRIAVQRRGSSPVILAGCDAVRKLRVEGEEGCGLAVQSQVEGLAQVAVRRVARDAATPHTGLATDLSAVQRGIRPAVTAAEAGGSFPQAAAA